MSLKGSNYPIVRPSLDLRFAQNRRLDPRVTFQRNSVGTYVDALGVLQTAAANVPRFDHDPETGESLGLLVEESRTNYVSYSNIQVQVPAGSGGWNPPIGSQVILNSTLAPDRTFTAALLQEDLTNGSHRIPYTGFNPAEFLTVSVFVKSAGVSTVRLVLWSGDDATFNLDTATSTASKGSSSIQAYSNGWYRIALTSSASLPQQNYGYFSIILGSSDYQGGGSAGAYLWGAQYEAGTFPTSYIPTPATFTSRASTATYYDANGVIQTAAIDVARDDAYFPDENGNFISAGLLIEESRTNFITRSEELDSTGSTDGWFPQSSSIFPNAILSPDGNTTADKLVENTLTSEHYIRTISTASVVSGNKYTISIFAKPAERSTLKIAATTGALPGSVTFDLINQTFSENGAVGHPVQVLPNGWYRCFATFTASASSTTSSYFYLSGFYAGDGTSGMYLWGAQFEAGAFPTSYIPTSGSTVTRAADVSSSSTMTRSPDVASITGTNFSSWYNQSEGSFYVKEDSSNNALDKYYLFVSDGANNDRLWISKDSVNRHIFRVYDSANTLQVVSASPVLPVSSGLVSSQFVGAYFSGDSNSSLNGSIVGASTNNTFVRSGSNSVYLGSSASGSNHLNGHIKRLAYYPYRLPDATLQALTS